MFNAIVRFSVRKKLFVGLTTLFLLIGGIYAMVTLPIDAVPDYQQSGADCDCFPHVGTAGS